MREAIFRFAYLWEGAIMCKGRLLLVSVVLFFVVSGVYAQFGDPTPRLANEFDGQVHVPTGRLMYSATDIVVPSRGPGIEFTRYYKNTDDFCNVYVWNSFGTSFGQNWRHSYYWQFKYEGDIYEDGYSYYSVHTGSGAVQMFRKVSYGVFEPCPGVQGTLEEVFELYPYYIYTTKHGVRYYLYYLKQGLWYSYRDNASVFL
jgi:hypothetical protein